MAKLKLKDYVKKDCGPGHHPYRRRTGPRPMKKEICAKNPGVGKSREYYLKQIRVYYHSKHYSKEDKQYIRGYSKLKKPQLREMWHSLKKTIRRDYSVGH